MKQDFPVIAAFYRVRGTVDIPIPSGCTVGTYSSLDQPEAPDKSTCTVAVQWRQMTSLYLRVPDIPDLHAVQVYRQTWTQ